uniref:eukaryotic elongation factor 2 kinase n=1 Tax=Myxine glutinosa TaxID=7769 RepID=UPI0035901CF5
MCDQEMMFAFEEMDGSLNGGREAAPRSGSTGADLADDDGDDEDDDDDDDDDFCVFPITEVQILSKEESISHLSTASQGSSSSYRDLWKQAIEKAKHMPDPWAEFHLEQINMELATRFRYNALTGLWLEDEVFIKMAKQPFGRGAMRECYRMKKLSNFTRHQQWNAASNYVAKRYIEKVSRETYFEDVRLQMEAKLWGEEYNRHNPPKKVDIMQVCILELKKKQNQSIFHLEHYIEGKYIKYNSNSGFVRDENMRCTPQAFSHFTFERSSHQLIVVDIQGVGDLWTDPQIHTSEEAEYGDGNLGEDRRSGMALFFHSHACNRICKSMSLTPFDLSPSEREALERCQRKLASSKTVLRSHEICGSPRVPTRSLSESSRPMLPLLSMSPSSYNGDSLKSSLSSRGIHSPTSPLSPFNAWEFEDSMDINESELSDHNERQPPSPGDSGCATERKSESETESHTKVPIVNRKRPQSESDEDSIRRDFRCGARWEEFHTMRRNSHMPASVAMEEQRLQELQTCIGRSILSRVHLEVARYHEAGRFCSKESSWDRLSALFHLQHAARCGELQAIVTLGYLHFGLCHDFLVDVELPSSERSEATGFEYLLQAADAGDRRSMVFVARALYSGNNLGPGRHIDWSQALRWFSAAVSRTDYDEGGEYDGMTDDPCYMLLARQAEIYLEGGNGVDRDPQKAGDLFTEAADAAMEATKGRLANGYYQKAEKAWAEIEE